MPTNNFFQNFPGDFVTQEQLLIEDLVIESMQIYGMDLYYLPRSSRSEFDYLYGEDVLKAYTIAYPIEMYLENVTGMGGDGDFISKFGLEIRDEITMLVSRRRFKATVPQIRPNEGDLIYVPMVQSFFEITFVEHENDQAMFHTLGRGRGGNVYLYALKLKQYVFSNEVIETQISEINQTFRVYWPRVKIDISSVSGKYLNDEIVYQGTDLANAYARAYVYDYTPNTVVEIYRTQGIFTSANGTLKGVTSNASANISSSSDTVPMNTVSEDIVDNHRIQTESETIIDFSENNPFGT